MKKKTKENISVVIPNRNCKFIGKVIKTLESQLSCSDEIIIVNDDTNNIETVERILTEYGNITALSATVSHNRSFNRNMGIELAKNDIILFLDGDILLTEKVIEHLREDFVDPQIIAVTGFIDFMEYTPEQLLLFGISPENIVNCYEKHTFPSFLSDYRRGRSENILNAEKNWYYFFSGILAFRRKLFPLKNYFNENLKGWGGEDVEFAYKLSQCGKLFFDTRISVLHLPHERDHAQNLMNNRRNLYFAFKCNPNVEFELLLCFNSPYKTLKRLESLISEISDMRTFSFPRYAENTLYCYLYDGIKSNFFLMKDGKYFQYKLIGAALPFSTESIETCYLDASFSRLPRNLLALVLRECLRIAKKVIFVKTDDGLRLNSEFAPEFENLANYIDYSQATDLRLFNFIPCEEGFIVKSSLPKYDLKLGDD